ncbi:uncharacterized protein STEHIDRAFT_165595 [Stereum hirsutum FP-91666 SS1]|uniref:uncharacterized protein n=1 Tax=Stereum hirsutum (strain FP-91666) TaxID=721885 RepID=UPI000440E117|nr:uncharacterized protein STEHIDRAFT_165595 [Stereum hirsutum FP-91666 SS1]EIM91235.1 hypothetical protein STEHIDRAFT_165595 [Stereum hirsutum FP-91666 SS1]
MSLTTIPLALLDCINLGISLENSAAPSWNIQTMDRRSDDCRDTVSAHPCITVSLVRNGTLDSIQIRTSLPPSCSPNGDRQNVHGTTSVVLNNIHDPRHNYGNLDSSDSVIETHPDSAVPTFDGIACDLPHGDLLANSEPFYDMANIYVPSQVALEPSTDDDLQISTPSLSHPVISNEPIMSDRTHTSPSLDMTTFAMISAFDEGSASPWSLNNVSNTQYTTLDQCYASAEPAVSDEWLSFSSPQAGSSSSSIAPSPSSSAPGDDSTTSSSPNVISTSRQRRLQCLDPSCTRKFANEYTRKVHMGSHLPKRRYICREGCSAEFSRLHDRLRHEAGKHNQLTEWFCFTCLRPFSSKKSLNRHTCTGTVLTGLGSNDNDQKDRELNA